MLIKIKKFLKQEKKCFIGVEFFGNICYTYAWYKGLCDKNAFFSYPECPLQTAKYYFWRNS